MKTVMQNEENNDHLAYWLSNASSLLFLLQRSLKAAGAAGTAQHRKPPPPTSLFGRMTQVCNNYDFLLYDISLSLLNIHDHYIYDSSWMQKCNNNIFASRIAACSRDFTLLQIFLWMN